MRKEGRKGSANIDRCVLSVDLPYRTKYLTMTHSSILEKYSSRICEQSYPSQGIVALYNFFLHFVSCPKFEDAGLPRPFYHFVLGDDT